MYIIGNLCLSYFANFIYSTLAIPDNNEGDGDFYFTRGMFHPKYISFVNTLSTIAVALHFGNVGFAGNNHPLILANFTFRCISFPVLPIT